MKCCGDIEEFEAEYICTNCFTSFQQHNKSECCKADFFHENSYKHCEKCWRLCGNSTIDSSEYSREEYPHYVN